MTKSQITLNMNRMMDEIKCKEDRERVMGRHLSEKRMKLSLKFKKAEKNKSIATKFMDDVHSFDPKRSENIPVMPKIISSKSKQDLTLNFLDTEIQKSRENISSIISSPRQEMRSKVSRNLKKLTKTSFLR